MNFEPKTIPYNEAYGRYKRILTVSYYTKRKNVAFDLIDGYKSRCLLLTGATFVRYENNPAFNTEVRFHTVLCAN